MYLKNFPWIRWVLMCCTLVATGLALAQEQEEMQEPAKAVKSLGPHPKLLDGLLMRHQGGGNTEVERLRNQTQMVQTEIEAAKLRIEFEKLNSREYRDLQKEMHRKQTEIELAKLRAELSKFKGGSSGSDGEPILSLPKVVAVLFYEQKAKALLQLEDSQQLTVALDEEILGYGRVVEVSRHGVMIKIGSSENPTKHRLSIAKPIRNIITPDDSNGATPAMKR